MDQETRARSNIAMRNMMRMLTCASTKEGSYAKDEVGVFYPSIDDVLRVRLYLNHYIPSDHHDGAGETMFLPAEIVDMIIDFAEYWPSAETHLEQSPVHIRQDDDKILLHTSPLCYDEDKLRRDPRTGRLPHRTQNPCRKIKFRIASHDQGWAHDADEDDLDDSYANSYTWFETEVIPQAAEKLRQQREIIYPPIRPTVDWSSPARDRLQCNVTAKDSDTAHEIIWHYLDNIHPDSEEAREIADEEGRGSATLDGQVVRNLNVGDSLVVWGKARFPEWNNHVSGLSVRVFWAI